MTDNIKTVRQALNPAYLKQKIERAKIDVFKKELITLLDRINESESEEFHKNLITEFLNSVYYRDRHYINTKERTDLVIHNGDTPLSPVGVMIEVKKPANKAEMISKNNLNVKSLHELLLYYLRERKSNRNIELKYLIITNIYEWYIFDARNFENTFGSDTQLEKQFTEFENKTSAATTTNTFYKEIADPAIEKYIDKIEYAHFNIRNYDSILRNEIKEDDKELAPLYKFLSPVHLLKLPFAGDNNRLNKEFYAELLHILGLEETVLNGKKLIVRKKAAERHNGSIIENTIERIRIKGKLDNFDAKKYGGTKEEQLFGIALDLAITWINRILFLKLLEAQIIKYHNGNKTHAFMSPDKLYDYDDLDYLFFAVLARKTDERETESKNKFANVPYLNSSLFEITEIEDKTICIDSLQDNITIAPYPKSVLNTNKPIKPLEYLLRFLDAYDFSSESSEEIQEENKSLISSSVLGLIFEKINGYKDGSFFTPSFITMYMCHETISKAVIQKFNQVKNWKCRSITDLYNKIENLTEAGDIFNSIRICDPAVGSGHFLVSALNEMIYLKAELGILLDKSGKRLKEYKITIENDELIICDREGRFFNYNPKNDESQRVQETLFHEKQTIIENCLFGVDINPNSVKICQLRLWIELLKHAYYRTDTNELETLPNIDINIKPGDSLISRFDIHGNYTDLPPITIQKLQYATREYKAQVKLYKCVNDKPAKTKIRENIDRIKQTFSQINNPADTDYRKWKEAEAKSVAFFTSLRFDNDKETWEKQFELLQAETGVLREKYEQKIKTYYSNAFEWAFEFPEALDENGNFAGFDILIGNPPFIQLQSMGNITDVYKNMRYNVFERTGDIYCLFYELGYKLLKPEGHLALISSNKWMRAGYGEKLRNFFVENTNPIQLIDFAGVKVFDEATVDVNILILSKDKNRQKTKACIVKKDGIKDLGVYFMQHNTDCPFSTSDSWVILSPIEQRIKTKIEAVGTPLKKWDINIYRGILTGYNEAFIIDGKKKDELIAEDPKSEEIIRPFFLYTAKL
jgi:hypothetical protein